MYAAFDLTLVVNHACNLRCDYCYTGEKFRRRLPESFGNLAIQRAVRSLAPGGCLELGFFGGEPLLEAELILRLIDFAAAACDARGGSLRPGMTTNGTIETPAAWRVMRDPRMDLSISFDGLPEVHDRHRRDVEGRGSSAHVAATIRRLVDEGKDLNVVMVVGPDTCESLADGIAWLRGVGVRRVTPSLDLWREWSAEDAARLTRAIARAADVWFAGLPDCGVSWFDEKLVSLVGAPVNSSGRCGFGSGEIAVAPSGNLYPCERVIGEDRGDNPLRLPGHVASGDDFLFAGQSHEPPVPCDTCPIQTQCGTSCRCGNFVRTGDANRPDGLLCLFDQACWRETRRVASGAITARPAAPPAMISDLNLSNCGKEAHHV